MIAFVIYTSPPPTAEPLLKEKPLEVASKPYVLQYGYVEYCRKEVIMWFMEQLMKKEKNIIHI